METLRTIVKGGDTHRGEIKAERTKDKPKAVQTNRGKKTSANVPSSHDSCDNMLTYLCSFQLTVAAVPPKMVSQAAAVM